MALKILKKTVNIELCHELLKIRLYYDAYQKYHIRLQPSPGQQAGRAFKDVAWTKRDGFWMYLPDPWQENVFGLSARRPSTWGAETVACTFDFHPSRSGAFGRDDYGGILILHTGDIPLTDHPADARAVFWRNYRGPRIEGLESTPAYAVVAHLGALDVTGQLRAFLDEVVRIQHTTA